jgi:cobalt-zinc-cadmium efflux system outer membrane protein
MMNYLTDFGFQRKFSCFLLVLISAILPLSAQQNLTLQEALAQAQNNQLYQARLAQIEVVKARVQQAEKRPNPRLETEFETEAISGEKEDYKFLVNFLNTWERGGARGLRQQIAQAELEQAALEAEHHLRTLTSEIRLAYLELLRLQKRVVLLEGHSEKVNQLLQFDQVRVQEGEIPSLNPDYLFAEVTVHAAEKEQLETQRRLAQFQLNVLMGVPVETEHVVVEEQIREAAFPAQDQVLSFALKNRADLRNIRIAIGQADLQVSMENAVAKRDWEWGVGYRNARKSLGSEDFSPAGIIESVRSTSHELILSLTIPLPIADNNSGNLASAVAAKRVRERELAHAESVIRSEVLSAYQEYQFNQQRGELYRQTLLPKLQESAQRLDVAYQLTGEGVTVWMGIQRDFLEAAIQGLEADFQLRASVVKLEQAVGGSLEEVMQSSSP